MKEASVLVLSPWLVETAVTLPLPTTHIESSCQIEDAFHGIAILSLSIVMEYLSM